MVTVTIKATFKCDVKKVWDIVTNLKEYSWREDLSKIEVVNDQEFIEYTKDGYQTNFTITKTIPYKCWGFDMDNSNMKGHWIGVFSEDNNQTIIEFTEIVDAKKLIMKPLVKTYLKKQQKQYIEYLQKAVNK